MGGAKFYEALAATLFPGGLTERQIDVIEAILGECEAQQVTDLRQVAYCLATTYHECYNWNQGTAGRMVQLKEMGGEAYLKSKPYYPYFGRGPSHLTHIYNYRMEGKRMGLDLVKNPDLMLDLNIGAQSHVYCMVHGSYTGHKLSDYINDIKCDFEEARRIINGVDKKELVAGYALQFYHSLL